MKAPQCTELFLFNGQISRCELPDDHDSPHEVTFDTRTWITEDNGKVIKFRKLA